MSYMYGHVSRVYSHSHLAIHELGFNWDGMFGCAPPLPQVLPRISPLLLLPLLLADTLSVSESYSYMILIPPWQAGAELT